MTGHRYAWFRMTSLDYDPTSDGPEVELIRLFDIFPKGWDLRNVKDRKKYFKNFDYLYPRFGEIISGPHA